MIIDKTFCPVCEAQTLHRHLDPEDVADELAREAYQEKNAAYIPVLVHICCKCLTWRILSYRLWGPTEDARRRWDLPLK